MPVSRNLSLPASIEGRKLKKRPDTLNRCISDRPKYTGSGNSLKPTELTLKKVNRPNFILTTVDNRSDDVKIDESPAQDESNKTVAESNNDNGTVMGVDTTSTRGGSLSQPCLPVSTSVGATRIFPHLYLGSQKDVVDEAMMHSNDITYVLNVSKKCMQPDFIDDNHFHRISVHDSYQEKMMPFMREAIEFIEKVRKANQRVLVHCLAGVSRSATVAIAYVLHYLRINFEDAYRFVKEKRPSISPNLNFLGQLMEFERTLRVSGHMDTMRTGSLSDNGDDDSAPIFNCDNYKGKAEDDNSKTALRLDVLRNRSDFSPLAMPPTCSFLCQPKSVAPCQVRPEESVLRAHTQTSSFCKRRNAPALSKDVFSAAGNKNIRGPNTASCDTPMPKYTPSSKHGLRVNLLVNAPSTPRVFEASRRLGSDGNEKDENTTCESEMFTLSADTFTSPSSPNAFQNSIPKMQECPKLRITTKTEDDKFTKPRTAPNTPLIGRQRSGPWRPSQLTQPKHIHRHRRCASGGGVTDILLSSFPMKRRFEARTERSASITDVRNEYLVADDDAMEVDMPVGVKRGSSFSGVGSYYDHTEPSSRSPHKFVSRNSRSPKILRQSFNLNIRPIYPCSVQRMGCKSEVAHAQKSSSSVLQIDTPVPKFDCSHSFAPLRFDVSSNKHESNSKEQRIDDTLVINSMLPLTLSSPNTDKDGSVLFPTTGAKSPSSPATCPVLGSITPPTFPTNSSGLVYKGSFTFSPSRQSVPGGVSRPFMLSAGSELTPRWRCRDKRRQSVDSGYLSSSQASSQSSSSFTSPTSQQTVFGSCATAHGSFADSAETDVVSTTTVVTSHTNITCHVEGAFVTTPEDPTNSPNDPEGGRTGTPVERRGGVEIMSCS